ncbi:MAG TPA: zf-HC2 domain-containing protein [Candidatus Acidoferrales bacterium]|nr:zf-HC2 domain-containing protein [Candidatus Acidoferrales bacterium]
MNCTDIAELSPLYSTHELDMPRMAAFRAHLAECADCARLIQEQEALDLQLREAVLAEPANTQPIEARVMRAISEEPAPARPRVSLWRLASFAAAAAVLVATIFIYRAIPHGPLPRVFADAAEDHRDEVIQRQPRRWLTDQERISELAARRGVSATLLTSLAPAGYHLDRARVCSLNGRSYLHVVYSAADGAQEYSAFLRKRDGENLPGRARTTVAGKQIHVATDGKDHVAAVQSSQLTAFIVTDLPGDAALHEAEFVASVF